MDDVIGEQSGQKKDAEMEMDVVGEEDAISRIVGQVRLTTPLLEKAYSDNIP